MWVGIGTACLFAVTWPALYKNEILSLLFIIPLILALPVTFIGFGILYGGGEDAMGYALLAQAIVFILFWLIIYLILLGRYKKKQIRSKRRSTNAQSSRRPRQW